MQIVKNGTHKVKCPLAKHLIVHMWQKTKKLKNKEAVIESGIGVRLFYNQICPYATLRNKGHCFVALNRWTGTFNCLSVFRYVL